MRPAFGAGLENFLHEPNTLTTRRRIHDAIVGGLELWERRVLVDRVEVIEVPDEPTNVRIEIAYRLSRTGAPQQIAVTMTLEGNGEG